MAADDLVSIATGARVRACDDCGHSAHHYHCRVDGCPCEASPTDTDPVDAPCIAADPNLWPEAAR